MRGQRLAGARLAEACGLPLARRVERDGVPGGAGDGAGRKIDVERVLGEAPAGSGRRLHLAVDLRVSILERRQQLTGSVGRVTVDRHSPLTRLAFGIGGRICRLPGLRLGGDLLRVRLPIGASRSSASSSPAAAASPALPAVTVVAMISSESGSTATWCSAPVKMGTLAPLSMGTAEPATRARARASSRNRRSAPGGA